MDDLTSIIVRGVCECDPPNPVDSETLSISVQDLTGIVDSAVCVHLCSILPCTYYMDPPDGGDVSVLEQLRRMAGDAERYRKLRAMHWNESPLCVVADPKQAVRLGYDCPSGDRLDALLDGVKA